MSKKYHGKNVKEVDDAIRVLSSNGVLNESFLKNLRVLLRKHAQAFSYQAGRIESSLLTVVNAKKVSCGLQKSVHTHYSHSEVLQNKTVPLAAVCFSLLPSLTNPPYRVDRFLEFQLKLLYGLSESYCALLQLLKFSHVNLSSLHSKLASKCKHFVSLDSIKRDEMPSPEYLQLIFARIDFFIAAIRSVFEPTVAIECTLHLPMIVALFTAILSVEITAHGETSVALLFRSSQLLHCLSHLCEIVGSKLMPASVSLLTLMVYQLDWTAGWRDASKLTEGLVRHRLAAYRCLRIFVSGMTELSSSRVTSLLPRILDLITQDLVYCSEESDLALTKTTNSISEFTTSKLATSESFKRRVLLAALDVIARIFQSPEHFNHPTEQSLVGFGRLQLCLASVMRYVTSAAFGGVQSKQINSFHSAVMHPSVFIALLKTVRVVCAVSRCSRLHTVFLKFVQELKTHPDSQVRSTAREQLMLLVASSSLGLTVFTPESSATVTEPVIEKEVAFPVFNPAVDSVGEVRDRCDSIAENSDVCEKPSKRSRMESPEALISVNPEVAVPTEHTSTVDTCLSSFDPTFV